MTKTMQIRKEVKRLVLKLGVDYITYSNISRIMEKCNCGICDVQNQIDYFKYSPQTAKYR